MTAAYANVYVRCSCTASRVCLALYLYYDCLLWLTGSQVLHDDSYLMSGGPETRALWAKRSDQWWLAAIGLDIFRDLYELR